MTNKDTSGLSAGIGLGIGACIGVWALAYLFHIGPAMGPTAEHEYWWAFPYYITAVAIGVFVFLLSAFVAFLLIEKAIEKYDL